MVSMRILVIEDDPDHLRTLLEVLQAREREVIGSETIEEAQRALTIEGIRYSLVLSDVDIRGTLAFELLAKLVVPQRWPLAVMTARDRLIPEELRLHLVGRQLALEAAFCARCAQFGGAVRRAFDPVVESLSSAARALVIAALFGFVDLPHSQPSLLLCQSGRRLRPCCRRRNLHSAFENHMSCE